LDWGDRVGSVVFSFRTSGAWVPDHSVKMFGVAGMLVKMIDERVYA
jgi:hypothetical protein